MNEPVPDLSPGAGDPIGNDRVTLSFRPDLINSWLATGTAPALLVELGDQLVASGFQLRQVHPGTQDATLATWFEVLTADPLDARRVLAILTGHPAVAAAFVKPPEAPPS